MRALVLAVVLLLVGGCNTTAVTALDQAHSTNPLTPSVAVIPYVPGKVTEPQRAPCQTRDGGATPDPWCTPGAIGETRVDAVNGVCSPKFEAAHRVDVTKPRLVAMQAYGVWIEDSPVTEYDHRIPLALGGANSTLNLWPERSDLVGKGTRNAKDSVETKVWNAVCHPPTGRKAVALADAQRAFAGDWRTALVVLHLASH